jgi:hypothetical protein
MDGNKSNNRIGNLRIVSHDSNTQNAVIRTDNKSGAKGVFWHKATGKWHVLITANKKKIYLGVHEDFEFAEFLAQEARRKYHGAFANHGHGAVNG